MKTRRTFIDSLGRFGLAGAMAPLLPGCATVRSSPPQPSERYDMVVIGSGFGGTMTALWVTHKLNERGGNKPTPTPLRILMLEFCQSLSKTNRVQLVLIRRCGHSRDWIRQPPHYP